MNALHDLTLSDLHDARRMLHYPDHADTVADALAHWHDHLWSDYLADRKANPESFDKHTGIGSIHRRRWASRLWDARRALRDLR